MYIAGRKKDIIISGGINVYPPEIENVLRLHPGIVDCAVFGVPDTLWGEAVVAAVVLRDATVEKFTPIAATIWPGSNARRKYCLFQKSPAILPGKLSEKNLPLFGKTEHKTLPQNQELKIHNKKGENPADP